MTASREAGITSPSAYDRMLQRFGILEPRHYPTNIDGTTYIQSRGVTTGNPEALGDHFDLTINHFTTGIGDHTQPMITVNLFGYRNAPDKQEGFWAFYAVDQNGLIEATVSLADPNADPNYQPRFRVREENNESALELVVKHVEDTLDTGGFVPIPQELIDFSEDITGPEIQSPVDGLRVRYDILPAIEPPSENSDDDGTNEIDYDPDEKRVAIDGAQVGLTIVDGQLFVHIQSIVHGAPDRDQTFTFDPIFGLESATQAYEDNGEAQAMNLPEDASGEERQYAAAIAATYINGLLDTNKYASPPDDMLGFLKSWR